MISGYNSPNENLEYGYPYSNALLQFHRKLECFKLHKASRHAMKCDVIANCVQNESAKVYTGIKDNVPLILDIRDIKSENTGSFTEKHKISHKTHQYQNPH